MSNLPFEGGYTTNLTFQQPRLIIKGVFGKDPLPLWSCYFPELSYFSFWLFFLWPPTFDSEEKNAPEDSSTESLSSSCWLPLGVLISPSSTTSSESRTVNKLAFRTPYVVVVGAASPSSNTGCSYSHRDEMTMSRTGFEPAPLGLTQRTSLIILIITLVTRFLMANESVRGWSYRSTKAPIKGLPSKIRILPPTLYYTQILKINGGLKPPWIIAKR